ncbi:MAG TPA: FG-GAP-like repeat-containing protein [Candidatus Acidoferrales bacterium]|nr:FG-GAP-like repeat-containing protein [Candidatus Acidoferrales bacterium]
MFTSRSRRFCGWLLLAIATPVGVLYSTSRPAQLAEKIFSRTSAAPLLHAVGHHALRAAATSRIPDAAAGSSPNLSLSESQTVPTRYVGSSLASDARPLALATGDFDEDGVPDLISGYAISKSGAISLHRGNINALWPYGAALLDGPPPAFLPEARVFALPEAPDFVATGDFDGDGHWDVVTAQRGSNALYFLKGDGHGGFRSPQRVSLSGSVTAMISGEINRKDGLTDLIVAVSTANGARALVFESPTGALKAQPEIFSLPQPVTALALGKFDGGAMNSLAVAAGNQMVMIYGRDRRLSLGAAQRAAVLPAKVTQQRFAFAIRALTAGDFTGAGASVAALGDDGRVHILEHAMTRSIFGAKATSDPNFRPTFQMARPGAGGKSVIVSGTMTPGMSAKLAALRQAAKGGPSSAEWTERSAVALPSGFAQVVPHLVTGRVSGSMQEDILAVDSGNRKIHVLSTLSGTGRVNASASSRASTIFAAPASMSLLASLDAASAPAVVLPMRLSQHGLSGLVMLGAGQAEPAVMPQTTPPANIFTVTNTSDAIIQVGPEVTGPAGSLRLAIFNANSATGNSMIVFNIPTTDPGFNATTGAFLIQPLSEAAPGALNEFALDPINATVVIDGYTQPGASPNTLANGDNAKILIQIDGGKATTPGGSGLVPFDDVGSTYRGLAFTGWTNPEISSGSSGSTASGAEGMEANGVQDFIEGNFFGTDVTGKVAAPNRIGVFGDNGPGFGSTSGGNIIGGTTPQARNILSGNNNSGVLFLSTALEAQLQGNFIGLDATGAAIVSNPQEADRSNSFDGAGLNGATITIGGTLPGTGNVIAGNGTNVDINDLTNGGQASDSIVQGNLIGTDATGTVGIPNQGFGVSILNNPTDMLIGGTTPAARNIISGNLNGVYIFDNSFDNVIQGNYIGLDITGTKAVPNLQEGFITGATASSMTPAGDTTIGGAVAGAGNVISGNTMDGIQISGTSLGPNGQDMTDQGNFVLGNFIGTDATGKNSIPNNGNGISLMTAATNNVIGGTEPGSGNLIANNTENGVLIDPGAGRGSGNNTIANVILSNGGAGVRINSGNDNRISQNSIFGNSALGINLDNAGANLNTNCNSTNTGANNLQNAPVLTAGSGTAFITATATDPNGNTSEFSNAVAASLSGNILSLLGNFNSTPSTTYTIEFFSSTAADPSGFGQGQTYLGSTTVTTNASCTVAVSNPVNVTQADLSVSLSSDTTIFEVGPDFGEFTFTASVTNNGPATAHNVVLTDTLPAGLVISSAYCNVGPCQTPAATSLGNCTVSGSKVTCDLGTMAAGATAQATIPVQATSAGNPIDAASVTATEADPNLANNTANLTEAVDFNFPFIDHLVPVSALTQASGTLSLTVFGNGFLPTSAVTFNGTAVTTTAYLDNQVCGLPFNPGFCSAIQVSVPASLLGTAGTPTVTVTNPDPGEGGGPNQPATATFTLVSSCTYDSEFFGFNPIEASGDSLIPESVSVTTNAPTCPWTATSDSTWLAIVDNGTGTGSGTVDVSVAPNTGAARTGHITMAGQAVEIDQSAGDSTICTFAPNPASENFLATGGAGTFAVTTGSSCTYFVVANPQDGTSFITIPQSSSLLVGNGNPTFTVAANHGAPRTNTIMVGGNVFPVTQDAPSCFFTLTTTAATIPTGGASGTIGVIASSSSCAWTAKSSNSSLLSVTAGASGTGNGTVNYSVPANAGGPQTATITIGDTTGFSIFTETQVSAFTCTFTITPPSIEVSSNGLSNFVSINASYNFCKWTAMSSDPTALVVDDVQGQAGLSTSGGATGSGAVFYRVGQNTTGAPRTITITAGCQTFTVNQDGGGTSNPVPAITALQPSSATAGSGAFTLTVNGSGFVSGAVVNFNGNARTTMLVSGTQVTASILATDVASAGTPTVTVTNPGPGGGASNALTFTISAGTNNPVPTLTALQPSSATAGGASFTLTVTGTNFITASVVKWNGVALVTTFDSATQLTAAVPASDIATAGAASVTVFNPTPGGGTSSALTFTINAATNNPVPAITTLQPTNVTPGSGAFTLTVNGSNFVSGAVVNFNGNARTTTFVNATKVTAAILASDVASAGTPAVTVTNPKPGGGTSNSLSFSVNAANNPTPAITTLQPASATAGSGAFTITVNGSNFVSGAAVNFGGSERTTTFVSATKVTAAILASDVTAAGTPTVTVTNPTPGGGTSNALTLTINAAGNNPVPTLTTLQPASGTAGGAAFTLTVNGSGFVHGAVVNFNGNARTTTFVSATQVIASILATDVAAAGTPAVTVTNPTPGGGTSNALTFTINAAANNPVPTLTGLQPVSATAGGAAFTLTLTGTNFINTSAVKWNGVALTTTFGSATQLTAAVPVSDVAAAGTASVTVFNPTPGGGTSGALTFTINAAANNPVPTLTALQPSSATAGGAAFTLTLTGTNFISTSAVKWNGAALVTTFGSATQLTAAVPASDIAATGTASVTVFNPTPGGGTSSALTFTVGDFTISSPTGPQSVTAGQAATFTIATAAVGTFVNSISFTATGLPAGTGVTFSPASVSAGASTTMTVTTTARGTVATRSAAIPRGPSSPGSLPILFISLVLAIALLFGGVSLANRSQRPARYVSWAAALALLIVSLGYLSGCSGGFPNAGSNTGTPAGSSTITVTGSSGTDTHTTTVKLVVQ